MTRMFAALAALLVAIPALAQTTQDGFVRPPDVTAYVAVTDSYASGTTANVMGDNSNTRGGTMPVIAKQPADIPSTATGWVVSSSCNENVSGPCELVGTPSAEEAKARFIADFSHIAYDDPIRNWGQPGSSHCHTFFGNTNTNAFSTYAALRQRANTNSNGTPKRAASTISGGPYNGTGYWAPCIIKPNAFGDGKAYAVKFDEVIVYYTETPATGATATQRLPRGLRYILGTNMDDPYDVAFKAQIAAANAQPGTSGRYTYIGNGWDGWSCVSGDKATTYPNTVNGGNNYPAFQTAAGADPWGGTCTAGKFLVAHFSAPECYDGNNLWSPGGYKHLRQKVQENFGNSTIVKGCPNGWYKLPRLVITIWYKHQGWSDYSTWGLSSDAMATAAAQAINPAAPALRPGESMHTDWMNGWDDTTLMSWLNYAFGISGGSLHRLDSSQINATQRLQGGMSGDASPDGTRNPQVNQAAQYDTTSRSLMQVLPANPAGPHTTHAH